MLRKICYIILFCWLCNITVFIVHGKEIQLTDYNYVYAKRMLDGYSVVACSDEYEKFSGGVCDKIGEVYLKPNGTQLYNSNDYTARYGMYETNMNFFQSLSGDYFLVFAPRRPYASTGQSSEGAIDSNGRFVPISKYSENEPTMEKTKLEMLKINPMTEESECDRVDKSYKFKEKEINGTKYYALFKELKNDETTADFVPTEKPTEKYTEYIDQMYKKDLLFNNEMCFFKKGITRLDFGIALGRAYCDAVNYNIDQFTTDTHFDDVNNPYCLYLFDNDILFLSDNKSLDDLYLESIGIYVSPNSYNETGYNLYICEQAITQKTVFNALNKIAFNNHILSEWSKIRSVQCTEEECSRELAYSEIYKLYELLQNPDTPKDIDAMSGIYIIIGSLLILFAGAFLNDKVKCKAVK